MIDSILVEIAKQGIVGIIAVLFIIFYRKERKKVEQKEQAQVEMAKSYNRHIASLNEHRAEEIRIVAEALRSNADANHDVADSMERLRDFVINEKLRGNSDDEEPRLDSII